MVAWHEAGHAVIEKLFDMDVSKVTICSSTTGAGGVTFTTPKKNGLYTKNELEQKLMQLYGGRAAEYLYFGKDADQITTGAASDIEKATEIIYQLPTPKS